MIDTIGLVSTVVKGYEWLNVWHEQQANPPHLPENAILVFKRFKEAYDSKDVHRLSPVISDEYRGDIYGVGTKHEFLHTQQDVFRRLPWAIHPCLTINVYRIKENTQNTFSAIIDTHSIATVFGIPTFAYDSAPVRCQINPEQGLWFITEMFVERGFI